MSLAQRMHFLKDMFQMTAIAHVSVINHYHISGLAQRLECSPMARETWVQSQDESYQRL